MKQIVAMAFDHFKKQQALLAVWKPGTIYHVSDARIDRKHFFNSIIKPAILYYITPSTYTLHTVLMIVHSRG